MITPERSKARTASLVSIAALLSGLCGFFAAGKIYGTDRQRLNALEEGYFSLRAGFAQHLQANEEAIHELSAAQMEIKHLTLRLDETKTDVGSLRDLAEKRFNTLQEMLERRGFR